MRASTLVISGSPGQVCRIYPPTCLPHRFPERRRSEMNKAYLNLGPHKKYATSCGISQPRSS